MTFLDCPAYLDHDSQARCGLPAEITHRYTLRYTNGPVECATIRVPVRALVQRATHVSQRLERAPS
jgi:hypothetical protein